MWRAGARAPDDRPKTIEDLRIAVAEALVLSSAGDARHLVKRYREEIEYTITFATLRNQPVERREELDDAVRNLKALEEGLKMESFRNLVAEAAWR